jgi:hypothetical protein
VSEPVPSLPQPPPIPRDWQWWRLPRDLAQWAKFGFLIPTPETFVDTGFTVFELYWRPSEQYAYVLQDRRRIQTGDAAPPPHIINMPENDMLVVFGTPDWFKDDRTPSVITPIKE